MRLKNLSTFQGWIEEGKSVVVGERAQAFAKTPDGKFLALFAVEQTEDLEPVDLTMCEILTPEEREAHRPTRVKPKRVRVKLVPQQDGRTRLKIWVGSNKQAIALMKKNKYRFSGVDRRWVKSVETPEKSLKGLREMGYEVQIDA